MRIYFCLCCALFFLCQACQGLKKSAASVEDYQGFYQRFHRDSLFQLQRVRFPLDGYSIEGGQIKAWSEQDWVMHKNGLEQMDTSIYQTERYERHGHIHERIFQPNSGVMIERHFSLLNQQWFLTFYLYVFLQFLFLILGLLKVKCRTSSEASQPMADGLVWTAALP